MLLDGKLDLLFDYGIPEKMRVAVKPGVRVMVPLRERTARGLVMEVVPDDGSIRGLKPLIEVLSGQSTLSPELIALGRWLAEYYFCPVAAVLSAMAPQPVRSEEKGFQERLESSLAGDFSAATTAAESVVKKAPRQAEVLKELIRAGGRYL